MQCPIFADSMLSGSSIDFPEDGNINIRKYFESRKNKFPAIELGFDIADLEIAVIGHSLRSDGDIFNALVFDTSVSDGAGKILKDRNMISKLTLFEHDKVKNSEQNLQFEDVAKVIFGRSPDVIEHYYNG